MITKNPIFDCCRRLIDAFCVKPTSYAREIKIAKQLLYRCPDIEAWEALILPQQINSLSFFLTSDGEIFIPDSQANPMLLDMTQLRPAPKKVKTPKLKD